MLKTWKCNNEYDEWSRLTKVVYAQDWGLATESFAYDVVGNRVSRSESVAGQAPVVTTYQYDAMDRLLSTSGGEATAFEYTRNGALLLERHTLTNSVRRQLSWNAEGRLVAVSGTGGAGSYANDPQGRRISKEEGGHLTRKQYDGSSIMYEFDEGLSATKYFVHGTGVDDVLSVHSSSAVQYYQKDGLGSVVGLSNSTGSLVAQYVYKVFGERQDALSLGLSAAISNWFGFTGREHDSTGMMFYRARYMLPEQGRFGSRDTYDFLDVLSTESRTSLFVYGSNSPAIIIDPFGLSPTTTVGETIQKYMPIFLGIVGIFFFLGALFAKSFLLAAAGTFFSLLSLAMSCQRAYSLACALEVIILVGAIIASVLQWGELALALGAIGIIVFVIDLLIRYNDGGFDDTPARYSSLLQKALNKESFWRGNLCENRKQLANYLASNT